MQAESGIVQFGATEAAEAEELVCLQRLFDGLFAETFNTRLIAGDDEPLYLPADGRCDYHRIIFAHGFFASALHEIAHWCLAGEARRQLTDYGYWYCPDGRDSAEQRAFERVEVRPQALEWLFSRAAGRPFRVSSDNLGGVQSDPWPFRRAVLAQVHHYCQQGVPARAGQWIDALENTFLQPALRGRVFSAAHYQLSQLG